MSLFRSCGVIAQKAISSVSRFFFASSLVLITVNVPYSLSRADPSRSGIIRVRVKPGPNGTKIQEIVGRPSSEQDPIWGLYGDTIFVEAEYILNTSNCSVPSGGDGTWQTTTPPAHGNLSSKIVMSPVAISGNPGGCNGTLVPQNYLYDTLGTTSGITLPDDSFVASWFYGGSDFLDVDATAEFYPSLLYSANSSVPYTDVTGKTTNIAIGQIPNIIVNGPAGIQGPGWNQPGSNEIGWFQPSATACNASVPCPAPAVAGMLHVYTAPGNYTESFTWVNANGSTASVFTNFNVVGPTSPNIVATVGTVNVYRGQTPNLLVFGQHNPAVQGITFTGSAVDPPGFPGTLI